MMSWEFKIFGVCKLFKAIDPVPQPHYLCQSVDDGCLKALVLHHCSASSSMARQNYIHWVLEETTRISGCLPYPPLKIRDRDCTFLQKKVTSLHFPFYRQKCNRIVTKCYPSVLHHPSAPNVATNTWQSTGKREGHTRSRPWHYLFGA